MKILSIALLAVQIFAATALLFRPSNLLWMGLALYMYGFALRSFVVDDQLVGMRALLRVPTWRTYAISWTLNIAAGALWAIGAVLTLPPVFAAFVVFGATGWTWMWVWALKRAWNELEPSLPAGGA